MLEVKLAKLEAEEKLYSHLVQNLNLKKIEATLSKALGSFALYPIDKKSVTNDKDLECKLCRSAKVNPFECPVIKNGFCYPVRHENETFAYIIACRLKDKPPQAVLDLFGSFIETLLSSIAKEIEIEELHKTIKPRAIALSTVHTIHRLISSSLYLDPLLTPTVDLRTSKTKLKKVKIGRWAPGKAVKYGKSIKGDRYLATPLIDEDTIGVITLYDKVDNQSFNKYDVEIMKTLAEQAAIAIKNAQLYKEQEKLTMGSIRALAQLIESRGPGLYAPKASFLRIVQLMGQEFKMSEHELKTLQYATLLHDAGELMVPEKVLRKKGKLTDKEYKLIKEHPLKGAKIIKSLKSLKSIAPIIMSHHENYDGSGYPKGLKAGEIPIGGQIMAVVAAFEAMITKSSLTRRL